MNHRLVIHMLPGTAQRGVAAAEICLRRMALAHLVVFLGLGRAACTGPQTLIWVRASHSCLCALLTDHEWQATPANPCCCAVFLGKRGMHTCRQSARVRSAAIDRAGPGFSPLDSACPQEGFLQSCLLTANILAASSRHRNGWHAKHVG